MRILARLRTVVLVGLSLETVAGCMPSVAGPASSEVWVWDHSVGGFAGRRITPAEQRMQVRYRFGADGTLVVSRDPSGETRTRYTTQEMRGSDGSVWTTIRYADEVNVLPPFLREQHLRRVGTDTLVLSDPCDDCFEHVFVRQR